MGYEQINGTFDDIHDKLSKLVDILEYPNNGSITKVSLADGKIMAEEIGACPQGLDRFVEEYGVAEKMLAEWKDEVFKEPIRQQDCCATPRRHVTLTWSKGQSKTSEQIVMVN